MWTKVDTFEDDATLEETEVAIVNSGALVKVTSTEKSKMGNSPSVALAFIPGGTLSDFGVDPAPAEEQE